MSCIIRRVQSSDIPALLELCAEHARYEKADVVMTGQIGSFNESF